MACTGFRRAESSSSARRFAINALLTMGLVAALFMSGCFAKVHYLSPHQTSSPVFAPLPDPNVLVGLAVSGGGSRAATFAAGALEALAETRLKDSDHETSLLERVTHISSVSGGSLASAYYVVNKPLKDVPMLDARGLSHPYRDFFNAYKMDMQRNFECPALIRQLAFFRALNPTKLAYSFSEVWDGAFLNEITFDGLYKRESRGDGPRLILNGTLYNNGRRFVLTTLPPADFDYDFVQRLKDEMATKRGMVPEGELRFIETRLTKAKHQFLPMSFEAINGDHTNLRVSLAVATSASFPPVIGPVTYNVKDQGAEERPPYHHIGDGGLFDNLGTESLAEVFLKKITADPAKRGIIIVIDASYPFEVGNAELDEAKKGFAVFANDPARVVGIMEERANAYQMALWHSLRSQGAALIPDFGHLRIVLLKHTDAEWTGYQDLPSECRDDFPTDVTPQKIREAISQIPTIFRIDTPCHGALLIKAAHKVVEKNRERIVGFIEQQRKEGPSSR